jgi:general secretion pathway protein L
VEWGVSIAVDGGRDELVSQKSGDSPRLSLSDGAGGFLRWWGAELSAMTPGWLRDAFFPRAAVATVRDIDGKLFIQQPGSKLVELAPAPGKRRTAIGGASLVYLLPKAGALLRQKRLPRASRMHVQGIMDLQIPSETPFSADEIYSDTRITGEDDAMGEIFVSQALAPRLGIDEISARMLDVHGVRLAGVDVADAASPSTGLGFNLLPHDVRAPVKTGGVSLNLLLLVLLVISMVFAGWAWRDLQQRRLASAEAELALVEVQSQGALQVNAQVRDGIAGIQQMESAVRNPLRFAHVYETVSALLPDGTWLEEFNYTQPQAELSGFTDSSATVIEALEGSDFVASAKFMAPVVTDPQTGAERFRLQVTFADPNAAGEAK